MATGLPTRKDIKVIKWVVVVVGLRPADIGTLGEAGDRSWGDWPSLQDNNMGLRAPYGPSRAS